MIDHYAEHAKEKYSLPADWAVYRWICQPGGRHETLYFEIRGAVAPLKKSGSRNWRKRDKTTDHTCILPIKEHEDWLRSWEVKHGKCSECEGRGQAWCGWSESDGHKYKTCPACEGTGKPKA